MLHSWPRLHSASQLTSDRSAKDGLLIFDRNASDCLCTRDSDPNRQSAREGMGTELNPLA